MVHKLCNVLSRTGAIAIIFLFVNTLESLATEYVFTAPPEVEREVEEIPRSEEEYPLYECYSTEDDALDSHDCVCTDCESRSKLEDESPSELTENESDSE